MRRFAIVAVLFTLSLPIGLSVAGCSNNYGQNFCSGFQSGMSSTATAKIDLQPNVFGISLGYGQVSQVQTPKASNCHGQPSNLAQFTYGTSDLNLADISPSGKLCGGTWNRNSGNGVPDFTTCIATKQSGIAYITASGGGATSNPVPVFVHPPVTSVVLGGPSTAHNCPNNPSTGSPTDVGVYVPNSCVSQNQTAQLSATVYSGSGASREDITCQVGHLTFSPQDQNVVSIDQNGVATAHQPGGTVISATVAQATSTAGYFFTCPPKSIQLTVGDTDKTSIVVNRNNTQPLKATVLDTENNPITGLALQYTSNQPVNIPVNASGAVTPLYPGDAAITAQCLPGACNPSPQNQIANLSTGLPITSNPVQVVTPGPSSSILYMASPQSYNFVPVDFQSGTVGTPLRLPYQPNSMVMDETGQNIFFGSAQELMAVSLNLDTGATIEAVVPGIQGTVLAVSPDDSLILVHDPCRRLFELYTPPIKNLTANLMVFGAPGPPVACDANNQPLDPSIEINPPYSAAFTQDSQTLYVVYQNTLYTYSRFTGWHVCTENNQSGNCPVDSTGVAVTIPGVGAFASGPTTTAFGYCPLGPNNTGQTAGPPPRGVDPNDGLTPVQYYPRAATIGADTDQLASTTDGQHILGANAAGQLTDIVPQVPSGACPLNAPLQFSTSFTQQSLATPNIQSIDQVLASPNSQLAFVTFLPASPTGGNNTLPAYRVPCTQDQMNGVNNETCPAGQATAGQIVHVPLTGQAGAPLAGTFSPDTNTFYVATSRDDLVHLIDTSTLTDTQQINPGLTCGTTTTAPGNPFFACTLGHPVPAFFLAAIPRPSQGNIPAAAAKK